MIGDFGGLGVSPNTNFPHDWGIQGVDQRFPEYRLCSHNKPCNGHIEAGEVR